MRIISKFQDYYDCGVAYGVDEKIYFKRETTKEKPTPKRIYRSTRKAIKRTTEGKIYFCGKLYKYILTRTSKTGKAINEIDFNRNTADYKYYYSEEEYMADHPNYNDKPLYRWSVPTEKLSEYFKVIEVKDDEFIKRGVPYFWYDTNLPILKDFQFAKAVSPMVAFQEISMYLGVLNNPEQECEIEDKYRMKGHGMDCTSFRKQGKKKRDCK